MSYDGIAPVSCPCGHPDSSHDDFGCSRWIPAGMGAGLCGCGISARQLREQGDAL